ncbi:MAG: hypothetical protein ACM3Q2_16740 [Syntrophothermus sp.]
MKKIISAAVFILFPCMFFAQEKGTDKKEANTSGDVPKMETPGKHEPEKGAMRGRFIDADGDGINDIAPGQKMGMNNMHRMKKKGMEGFTDKDGDGINDNRAKGMGWSGKGKGHGFGKH